MATTPDQLTVAYVEEGVEKVREIDKAILSQSSSWATVAFLFREVSADGALAAPKVSVRRYRKKAGRYTVDKHFTLSSARQAHALQQALAKWFADVVIDEGGGADDDG